VRKLSDRVQHWLKRQMVLRWTCAIAVDAAKQFRCIKGYKGIPKLLQTLSEHDQKSELEPGAPAADDATIPSASEPKLGGRVMQVRTILMILLLGTCGALASCAADGNANSLSSCGDGIVGASETCDGTDIKGATCESLGGGPGTLSCASDCRSFDLSRCGAPAGCGDGVIDGIERCDGSNLGGQTCAGLSLGSGDLGCQFNCLGFDTSNCSGPASCGNGLKDGTETCDGNDLVGQTCESVGAGTGTLACTPNCIAFDTSGCVCAPACAGLECGPDPLCGRLCGACAAGSSCNAGKCLEICDLPQLRTNTTLDLDITTVTITGQVTLNGSSMPNDTKIDGFSRGRLRFHNVDTLSDYDVDFGEIGAVNYSVTLLAGVYDVYVHGDYDTVQSVLPGGRDMKVAAGVELKTSMIKNFDAKTLRLSGRVLLNGLPMPNDTKLDGQSRGRLRMRNLETQDDYQIEFGETGPVSYSITLFSGRYNAYVEGNYSTLQSVLPSARQMLVYKDLVLTTTTTRDFDARVITLSGTVTLNGETMPNDTKLDGQSRGRLRLRSVETGGDYDFDFGETGPVNHTLQLFAGQYDVFVHGNYATLQSVLPDGQDMLVLKGFALTANTKRDFNAKTLTLSGKITLNGATMPSDTKIDGISRGYLRLRNMETLNDYKIELGETGPVNYTQTIFAGLYDVFIHGNYDVMQSTLPSNRDMKVQTGLALTATTTKDFDAKTLTLSGNVTLNGAVMPNDTLLDSQSRGFLRLRNVETLEDTDIDIGETGPVNYSKRIFSGLYDVYIHGNYDTLQKVLPSNRDMLLQKGLALTTSTTQAFDAKTVTVTGRVTLNGATMPNDTIVDGYPRGQLRFRNIETLIPSGNQYDIPLGETGPVTYSQKLFAGAYDVLALGNYATLQSVLPGSKEQRLKKGCRK